MPAQITAEEITALDAYARKNGRNWKAALLAAWQSGRYQTAPEGTEATLQTIRNQRGPSWLRGFKMPRKAKK